MRPLFRWFLLLGGGARPRRPGPIPPRARQASPHGALQEGPRGLSLRALCPPPRRPRRLHRTNERSCRCSSLSKYSSTPSPSSQLSFNINRASNSRIYNLSILYPLLVSGLLTRGKKKAAKGAAAEQAASSAPTSFPPPLAVVIAVPPSFSAPLRDLIRCIFSSFSSLFTLIARCSSCVLLQLHLLRVV